MSKDELISETISFLRFPLIIGVVFIHFDLVKCHLLPQEAVYPNWFYFIITFFSNVLPRAAVPLFFFFSGFLFFYHTDFSIGIYKQKLLKRTKTLLIPYIIWNIIAVLFLLVYKIPGLEHIFPDAAKIEIQCSPIRILNIFFDRGNCIFIRNTSDTNLPYPLNVPMWYIRELFAMVLLAPFIFQIIKKIGGWFVLILGITWSIRGPLFVPEGGYFSSLFCRAAFFFSWGAYYSIENKNFIEEMQKPKWVPLLFLPFVIIDALTQKHIFNAYFHNITIIIGTLTFVFIAAHLLLNERVKVNKMLTQCSFFVYAFHNLILVSIGKALLSVFDIYNNVYAMLLFYFMVPVVTILICMAIYLALKRFFPAFSKILTGGR